MKKLSLLTLLFVALINCYSQNDVDSIKINSESIDSSEIIVYTTLQSCYLVDSIKLLNQTDSMIVSYYYSEEFPQCDCSPCQRQDLFKIKKNSFKKVIFYSIIRNCLNNCTSYSEYSLYAKGILSLSFFLQGSVWSYVHFDWDQYSFFRYTIDGDTTIDEKIYKKMYRFTSCGYNTQEAEYIGAFREDSDLILCRVYNDWWLPKKNGEAVLYDFSLNVGDKVARDNSYTYVEKVDTVTIDNTKRKRITFGDEMDVWIEGLGSTKRSFFESLSPVPTCPCGDVLNLFNTPSGITVYTNPDKSTNTRAFKGNDCAYHSLEGLHWEEVEYHFDSGDSNGEAKILMNYWIEGDTVFEGIEYKKLYRECVFQDSIEFHSHRVIYPYGIRFCLGVREDGDGRICAYHNILLYDFSNWDIGDTLFYTRGGDYEIMAIITNENLDSIPLLDGSYAKTVTAFNLRKVIRGIGCISGFLFPLAPYPGSYMGSLIIRFYKGDQLLWENPEYVGLQESALPKSALRVYSIDRTLSFEIPTSANQLDLYSIDGRLLRSYSTGGNKSLMTAQFPLGIYFYRILDNKESVIACGKAIVQ